MKDIVNVSIAGIAFRLDADAYARLSDYLDRVRAGYGDSPDGREIQSDIEARIAELILTEQDTATAVPYSLVDRVLVRLGEPEGVIDPSIVGSSTASASSSAASSGSIPHRLYRNPEGAKLGGVCSGLATYFNIDPAPIRLLFAAPLLLMIFFFILHWNGPGRMMVGFMTTAFILYPLLWIVIPKAKTPLQKLEMKGEKITRETIEQTYREEFDRRGNAPHHIEQRARNARNASVFSEIVSVIGRIVLFFLKAVAAVIGFGFIVAILALLIALFTVLFVPGSIHIHGLDVSPGWRMVLGSLVLLIPFLLAVYGILKFLFGFRHNRPLLTSLSVIWVLAFVFGTVIFIKNLNEYHFDDNFISWHRHDEERKSKRKGLGFHWDIKKIKMTNKKVITLSSDTLYVVRRDSAVLPDDFVLRLRDTTLNIPMLVRHAWSSKDTGFPSIEYTLQNDTLYLDAVDSGRFTHTEIDLYLPEGKTAVVAPGINYNEYYER